MEFDDAINKSAEVREIKLFKSVVDIHTENTFQLIETFEPNAINLWNLEYDPVKYDLEVNETAEIYQFTQSDDELVNKVVLALAAICKEMNFLANEANKNLYDPLLLYYDLVKASSYGGVSHSCFVEMLPTLKKVTNFIQQICKVVENVMQQLGALYVHKTRRMLNVDDTHFQVVFENLAEVLSVLIIFDEVKDQSSLLTFHFNLYKKFIDSADWNAFEVDRANILKLREMVNVIDNVFFCKSVLQYVLGNLSALSDMAKNVFLREEFLTVTIGWCTQIENAIADGSNDDNRHIVWLTSLSIFYSHLFDQKEKRLFRGIFALYKKAPSILMLGRFAWKGEAYLNKHFPSLAALVSKIELDVIDSLRRTYFEEKLKSLSEEVQSSIILVSSWMVRMQATSYIASNKLNEKGLLHRELLFRQGLKFAVGLQTTVRTVLSFTSLYESTLKHASIVYMCKSIEILKCIQCAFYTHMSVLIDTLPILRHYLRKKVLTLIATVKNNLKKMRHEVKAAFSIAERALSGNGTSERMLLARISLSLVNKSRAFSDKELATLQSLLKKIVVANKLQSKIEEATSVSFIYHRTTDFSAYLSDFVENPACPDRIRFMIMSVKDPIIAFKRIEVLPGREILIKNYREDIKDILKTKLLNTVAEAVEIDLHLMVNPKKDTDDAAPGKFLYSLVHLRPFVLFDFSVNIKEYVGHHLEKKFYGMIALSPHGHMSYELMRNLAYLKYGLIFLPSHLPSHNPEKGIDVLETVRKLHIFVKHYKYNLNQQFFIELEPEDEQSNFISISDIASSIRTHGTGIIATTVNFTYQFICRKVKILSQFLFDEQIQSRLLKDLHKWKEVKKTRQSYPYQSAEDLLKRIRRLGLSADGLSFLDQFRNLITQVGNAIGFVRLVRSGGLRCMSAATQFIPELDDPSSFGSAIANENLSESTKCAAVLLDSVIETLTASFTMDADYLKILVEAFEPLLQDSKYGHLQNFYLIVPSLTISYVDSLLEGKENMQKRYGKNGYFTDDGFALGISYFLAALSQWNMFDSLHWWTSLRRYFAEETVKIEQERINETGDCKLDQTLDLSVARLNEHLNEFDQLYLTVSSARVFFTGKRTS